MKKRKGMFLAVVLFAVFLVAVVYAFLVMMPLKGANKACNTSENGKSIAINGHIMWYDVKNETGTGDPIYVIPGGPGFSTSYLQPYLQFLENGEHPVIYYDGRCGGKSQYTSDLSDCTYENYAKDIEVLRNRITPNKKIILLAHSSGGATALSYLSTYEENLSGIILVSSVGSKTRVFFTDAYLHTGLPPLDQTLSNMWFSNNVRAVYGSFVSNKKVAKVMDGCTVNYALMMKNEGRDKYDYTTDIKKSDVPTLILYGKTCDTPITDKSIAEELHSQLKNSTIYGIKKSGHFCFAERPEEFQERIEEFLAQKVDKEK